jgi:two-component system response regulator YesN
MYKMIVIDDEYLVREGIKQTIEWDEHGVEIVSFATNGKEGLLEIEKHKPDIVICDIRMPIMDGLEVVKIIKERQYDLEIIILSGYKDFYYAKQVYDNGAISYLLKPVDNSELLNKVLDAISTLEEKRKISKIVNIVKKDSIRIINNELLDYLTGSLSLEDFLKYINDFDLKIVEKGYVISIELLEFNNCNKEILEILDVLKPYFLDYNTNFILSTDKIIYIISDCNLDDIFTQFENLINKTLKSKTLVIAFSDYFDDLISLKNSFVNSNNARKNRMFSMISSLQVYGKNRPIKPIIRVLLKFIEQNYNKNISRLDAAKIINYSESSISHSLKEELGLSFVDILTKYRILVAKKLLDQTKFRLYEISDLVGFNDVKYFSKKFKDVVGMTAIDYVNRNV